MLDRLVQVFESWIQWALHRADPNSSAVRRSGRMSPDALLDTIARADHISRGQVVRRPLVREVDQIGIGEDRRSRSFPSHTTRHAGPHLAVR